MVLAWYTYVLNIRICVTFLTIISITDLPDIKVIYFLFSCADAEDSSSSEPDDDGGGGAPPPSQPSRASPRPDSPGHGHPDEHPDENADEDLPYMSDDGPEYECEGFGTMSSHLAKLDSLSARGCADSKSTLPDGVNQCLVLETSCTAPVRAGRMFGNSGRGKQKTSPASLQNLMHSALPPTSLRGAVTLFWRPLQM